MSQANAAPREFWMLLNGALDGTLSDAEVQHLESYLDGDFGFQMLFRNYCQLHINLESETRAQRVIDHWKINRRSLQNTWRADDLIAAANAVDVASAQSTEARRAATFRWAALLACSAMIAYVVISLTAFNQNRRVAQHPTNDALAAAATNDGLDVITVRLSSAESRYLPIGEIGNIHIQGPAHLELIGTSRARLFEGRIKVRITDPRGRGFVVETPQGNVTDLGTEFGVDVAKGANTGVVVFEGSVDLALPKDGAKGDLQVQRLVQGEGLSASAGEVHRIMSIITGEVSTFSQRGETRPQRTQPPIIVDVFDNIRSPDLLKFYEIVPGGLQEDALAYVDRPAHDWSGVDEKGIPSYLLGADYIKPFNSDKMRSDVKIFVALACPARLFIFADNRVTPPQWLREGFRDTGDDIGHDVGPYELNGEKFYRLNRGKGPGKSIDSRCSVWERVVRKPATVELGPNSGSSDLTAMYGIAAVRLDPTPVPAAEAVAPATAPVREPSAAESPLPVSASGIGEK